MSIISHPFFSVIIKAGVYSRSTKTFRWHRFQNAKRQKAAGTSRNFLGASAAFPLSFRFLQL